jgi:hypothetical protein
MYPGYVTAIASTSDIYRIRVPRAGTIKNMHIMQNTVSTSTNSVVYTLFVGGVSTALTVSIAGNVSTGADTTDTVTVSQGDQLSIQVTKAASVSPAVQQVVISVEFS